MIPDDDREGDRMLVFRAMLMAYRDTVNPQIIAKFQHYFVNIGLSFTNNFSEMINIFFKT